VDVMQLERMRVWRTGPAQFTIDLQSGTKVWCVQRTFKELQDLNGTLSAKFDLPVTIPSQERVERAMEAQEVEKINDEIKNFLWSIAFHRNLELASQESLRVFLDYVNPPAVVVTYFSSLFFSFPFLLFLLSIEFLFFFLFLSL